MAAVIDDEERGPEKVGRYVLHAEIARGGMASVHAARVTGAEGFHRLVAAKRLHPEYAEDPEFVTMFHDEARIASRIHHPNVVPVLDVVVTGAEVMLVQEYVHGVPLSVVMRRARMALKPIPTGIAVAVVAGVLAGLHAAHEARDELGTPLDVIHRDVSPQNVMLSVDGVPRLLDFGIAKARTSTHQTRPGVMKGKLSYMAPEQIKSDPITRRADVYAAGVVMWELLANRRIGENTSEAEYLTMLFDCAIPTLVEECSAWRRSMGQAGWKRLIALDAVVMRALSLAPADRQASALEMAEALVAAHPPATQAEVGAWLSEVADDYMAKLRRTLAQSEELWRATSRVEPATLSRRRLAVPDRADPEEERMTVPTPRVFLAGEIAEELAAVTQAAPPSSSRLVASDESELIATAKRPPRPDEALFVLPRSSPRLETATPSAGFAPLADALDSRQLAAAAAAREALGAASVARAAPESRPRLPSSSKQAAATDRRRSSRDAPSSGALPSSDKRRSSRDASSAGAPPSSDRRRSSRDASSAGAPPSSERRRSSRDAPRSGVLPSSGKLRASRDAALSDADARLAALVDGPQEALVDDEPADADSIDVFFAASPFARTEVVHDSAPPESVPAMTQSGAPGPNPRRRAWPWLVAAAGVFAASFVATQHVSQTPALATSAEAPAPVALPSPASAAVPPLPAGLLDLPPVGSSATADPVGTSAAPSIEEPPPRSPAAVPPVEPVASCAPPPTTTPTATPAPPATPAATAPPPPPKPAHVTPRSGRDCRTTWDPAKRLFTTVCRR